MAESFWETFGTWLKSEREKANVSQGKVSRKADIHVVQISRIENGHSGAKRETIIQIVNAINELSERYKINLDEALNKAGFALQNEPEAIDGNLKEINEIYNSLQTPEYQDQARKLFQMMRREVERLAEEERLRLLGNDAVVNENGETIITIRTSDISREGS